MTALRASSFPGKTTPFVLLPVVLLLTLVPALLAPAHAQALEKKAMGDVTVEKGETVEEVRTGWGDVRVEGEVEADVSSGFGNVEVNGPVGGDVEAGFGDVYVDSRVEGDVKVGHGNVELGANAEVIGDIARGSGRLDREPESIVRGQEAAGMASDFDEDSPLAAFSGVVGWGVMALGLAAAAILLAVVAPGPLRASARSLERAPGRALLVGVSSFPAMVVVSVLLAFTGVGLLLIPLAWPAYLALVLFGTLVAAYFLGRKVVLATGHYRAGDALAAVVGALLVSAAYHVPFLGGLLLATLAALGTGATIFAFLSRRRGRSHAPHPTYASYEEYLAARRDTP